MTEQQRSAMQTALEAFDAMFPHKGMMLAIKDHGLQKQVQLASERLREELSRDTAEKLSACGMRPA